MFLNMQWYHTGTWCGFFAIIALVLYIYGDRDNIGYIGRAMREDIRTRAYGSLAGSTLFCIMAGFALFLFAAVYSYFWPLSVSFLLYRAGKTYRKRHSTTLIPPATYMTLV